MVALATFIALPNSHGFLPDADDASGSMVTIRTSSALVRGDAQQLRHITRYIYIYGTIALSYITVPDRTA